MSVKTNETKTRRVPSGPAHTGLVMALLASALPVVCTAEGAGMQVAKDPVTGKLRAPTHEEFKALQEQENRANIERGEIPSEHHGLLTGKPSPQPEYRRDGSVKLELDESTLSYSVVTKNPDGTLNMNCVTGADTAEKVVKGEQVAAEKLIKEDGHAHR